MLPHSDLEIQHLTWTDVRDRLANGYKTVIFAAGATEQHGPHMPIAVDTLIGTAIARAVAKELGNALVAPTIRPGYSPHHMDFPGTITLRHSTLIAIIIDYCTSLVAHGFDTLVVISSHGGNTSTVKMAAQEAQESVGSRADVIAVTNLMSYYQADYDRASEGFHATRTETSLVLSLVPDLVHMERAKDWTNPIEPGISDVGALLGMRPVKHFAPDGTMGLPTKAEAQIGKEALALMSKGVSEQVRMILKHIRNT